MIYFIGAGPGDPELITLKGKRIIDTADVIIYAGSLVNEHVLDDRKAGALVYNSAYMNLDEVIDVMKKHSNELIARVHTGDPSIYGAIKEQMDKLQELHIDFEVVPGVSSAFAAAAALHAEYTLPDVSQTVIFTRMAGRTPMPAHQSIQELAAHKASMIIFLSIGYIDEMVQQLKAGGYADDTPAAVVYKASWPDEKIIVTTIDELPKASEGVDRTALVLVGDFLDGKYELSKLYDKNFSTMFRQATNNNGGDLS